MVDGLCPTFYTVPGPFARRSASIPPAATPGAAQAWALMRTSHAEELEPLTGEQVADIDPHGAAVHLTPGIFSASSHRQGAAAGGQKAQQARDNQQ